MKTMNPETAPSARNTLSTIGGIAALVAGVLFRRNLGAEISLLGIHQPETVAGWFSMLQTDKVLGLAFLGFFDVINYILLGFVFLGLYAALNRSRDRKSTMAIPAAETPAAVTSVAAIPAMAAATMIATVSALAGAAARVLTDPSLFIISLSTRYSTTGSEAERAALLAEGEAMLAKTHGTGFYVSVFLMAAAHLLVSVLMLRRDAFTRRTAYIGIAAAALDLVFCAIVVLVPGIDPDLVGVCTMPLAGLSLMAFHVMVGLRLLRLRSH